MRIIICAQRKQKQRLYSTIASLLCQSLTCVNILTAFLGLKRGSSIAVWVRKLSDFIINILICVQKMNEGFTGLERHEGMS